MIAHRVKFRSNLDRETLWKVAREREPEYRKVPGLLQKFYIEMNEPDTYCGFMIWESKAALEAFLQTDLSRTVGQAYQVNGAPQVEIGNVEILLNDSILVAA